MVEDLVRALKEVLSKDKRIVSSEGELLKNKIVELGWKLDEKIVENLHKNKELKKHFFKKIDGALLFDQNKFMKFIDNKEFLPDSFTSFKNKIGLTKEDNFLSKGGEVVLSWAYKDCILEGGMTKEDQKRKEVFFNEILAPDQIDRLKDIKVLTNFKKYNKNGENKVKEIKPNDNLIIKGNNLLALYTLRKKFAGKIKLIYIDPPYNTGSDSFGYNDSFNHSTWLTFMKNRLEVARDLLRDDGIIFIQADNNEVHYLKILMDEIFGRDKFINEIIWKRKFGNANETKRFATAFDNILLYSKTENYNINLIREKNSKHVKEYIKNRFTRKDIAGKYKGRLWMPYPLANPGKPTKNLIYEYKGYKCPPKGWRMTKQTLTKFDKEGRLYFPEDKKQRIQEKKFLDEYDGQPVDTLWQDIFVINSQSKESLDFIGQKPEDLLKRIILIGTSNKNDIILDYHLGSGTTAVVAHKMNRQYIGIEQLNYEENGSVTRLKNVIKGDPSGISKELNWKGGGEFVYCELMKWNEIFIDKVMKAKNHKELIKIWNEMKEKAFLSYRVKVSEFDSSKKEFAELSLENQKKFLIKSLDMNQLYVNLSEIEDKLYNISREDKELNNKFHREL